MESQLFYKKLNEDDILEILLEHFQNHEFKGLPCSKGAIMGEQGKDLRFISIFASEDRMDIYNYNLEKIDKEIDFNGAHQFLSDNPTFNLNNTRVENEN